LIYIDPPFFSNRNYEVIWGDEAEVRSFEDRWEGGMNVYIGWMADRVRELHRVLKLGGSFYLHCDWHASAYLRVMMDEIFESEEFRNEIIWRRESPKGGKITSKQFPRDADHILFYTKGKDCVFNCQWIERKLTGEEARLRGYRFDETRKQFFKTAPRGNYTDKSIAQLEKEGRIHRTRTGKVRIIYWLQTVDGYVIDRVQVDDIWTDLPGIMHLSPSERLGFPTQKPEKLLERIIKASSNKGDIILDAFCGCGTAMAVAQKLGRRWVGIDISPTAIKLVEKRVAKLGAFKDKTYVTENTPTTVSDLKEFKPLEFQNWVIDEMGARHSKRKVGDMGLDGYFVGDLWRGKAGVQVKQSEKVGRNVVDNFETALKRAKYKNGYIVAFSFTRGAREEVARAKRKDKIEIKLINVSQLLNKKKPIL
jgi:DNA modification methylase